MHMTMLLPTVAWLLLRSELKDGAGLRRELKTGQERAIRIVRIR